MISYFTSKYSGSPFSHTNSYVKFIIIIQDFPMQIQSNAHTTSNMIRPQ